MSKCQEEVINKEYIANTVEALDMGIFEVSSFSIKNEIFWGDDRLEDAIEFLIKSLQ